jgi:hypothetical protein
MGFRFEIFLSVQDVLRTLRAATGFRLRWLSERGRLDCAGTGLLGMLKRVPVSGCEGWWRPGCGWCSCPVAGMVTLPATFCRSGLQAAIGVEPSAPGDASYENLGRQVSPVGAPSPTRSQKQQVSGSRLQESRSRQSHLTHSPPRTGTRFSIHR